MSSLLLSIMLLLAQARGQGRNTQQPAVAESIRAFEVVAGTVMQGETQRPLAYVRVELRREEYGKWLSGREKPCNPVPDLEDPTLHQYASTDVNGRFAFQNVPPGRYYLAAEHEGYLRAEYGARPSSPRGVVLEIGEQNDALLVGTPLPGVRGGPSSQPSRIGLPSSLPRDLTLRIYPAATISGRVHNDEGTRVPAAVVQVYQYRYAPLNGRTLKPIRSIFTDDNGEYRLFWLNPGRYMVAAAYSDYILQPWKKELRFTPNLPDADNRYPMVFYPNVEQVSEAQPINLGTTAGPPIDFTLWKRPRFNVELELFGASVPSQATLLFVPEGGDLCSSPDYGMTPGKNGVIEIRDVPAGRYMFMAVNGRDAISEFHTLVVDQHIRERVELITPIDIDVQVTSNPPGADLRGVRVNLTRAGNEVTYMKSAERNANGKLQFRGVAHGTYYVTADSAPGYYVSDVIALGPLEICLEPPLPVEVIRSAKYQYLDTHGHLNREKSLIVPSVMLGDACRLVVTVRSGGRFHGRVLDRRGDLAAGAFVVGYPRGVW